MSLTTVAETFLAGKDAVLTIGTIADFDIMDGSFKVEAMTDDMTGTGSAGWYADVKTILKATGTLKIAFRTSETAQLVAGAIYAATIVIGSTGAYGPYLGCNMRINSAETPILNVKGGITQTFSFTSQGACVLTHP